MAKIPEFKTEEEEQKFWDTHDSTDYLSDMEEIEPFKFSETFMKKHQKTDTKRHLTIRINQRDIEKTKVIAEEKGLGYQTLMRMWIVEGIKRETHPPII